MSAKTGTNLTSIVNKTAPTVPEAMKALAAMGRELNSAKTYQEIRKIECATEVMRKLYADVDEVRKECEIVILLANRRIGIRARRSSLHSPRAKYVRSEKRFMIAARKRP
jgi:hypothetical protein